VQFRLRTLLAREGAHATPLEYSLFTDGAEVLPTYNSSVRRTFTRVLQERHVTVHAGTAVTEVAQGRLRTADGVWHEASEVLWSTEAAAAPWLAGSGLAVDRAGFVSVSNTLQSLSHPDVFAAGDIASMVDYPRERSGALAVHQGPWLAGNLRSALQGTPLAPHRPRRHFLSLISTGDRYAVASYGPLACEGAWVWRWKDRIDRRFMRTYTALPVKA
jgi:selenide,water dikinase